MKKSLITSLLILAAYIGVRAQNNNIQLSPAGGNVCNPMTITLAVNGNGFTPVTYLWSTGETSPTIEIVSSGTYTLTVTGYHGNSNNMTTITRTANYNVLPAPSITALTDLWVCKGDTVKLSSVSGYDYIQWSNGTTGTLFQRKMNLFTPGTPQLDTVSVNYTATVDKVCSVTSQSVVLRAIRKPHGVGVHYQNKMNIQPTDSIPAGLVLQYLYPVTYDMEFTETTNPNNIIKYVTTPGSRKAPASILTPGSTYTVKTTPIINGKVFCTGPASLIGIASPSANSVNRMAPAFQQEGISTFRIFDVSGKLLGEKTAENFDMSWLEEYPAQVYVIHRIGITTEVIKLQTTQY
jgi:hypothetical protein